MAFVNGLNGTYSVVAELCYTANMKQSTEDQPVTISQIRTVMQKEIKEALKEAFIEERKHTELALYEERKYTKQMVQQIVDTAVDRAVEPLATKKDLGKIRTMLEGDHAAVVEDVEDHEKRIVVLEHKTVSLHS